MIHKVVDGCCDPAIRLDTGLKVELAASSFLLIVLKSFFAQPTHNLSDCNANDCNVLFEAPMLPGQSRAQIGRVTSSAKGLI